MTTCNHCGAKTDGLSEEERAALAAANAWRAVTGATPLTSFDTFGSTKAGVLAFYRAARAPLETKVLELEGALRDAQASCSRYLVAKKELEAQLAARGGGLPDVGEPVDVVDPRDGSRWARATVKLRRTYLGSPAFEVNERVGLFSMSDIEFTWRRIPAQESQEPAKRKCSHRNGTMQGNQGTTLCVACGDRVVPSTAAPDEVTMEHSKKFWSEGGGIERDNWAAIEADIRTNVARETAKDKARIAELEQVLRVRENARVTWANMAQRYIRERDAARAEVARLTEELERAKGRKP